MGTLMQLEAHVPRGGCKVLWAVRQWPGCDWPIKVSAKRPLGSNVPGRDWDLCVCLRKALGGQAHHFVSGLHPGVCSQPRGGAHSSTCTKLFVACLAQGWCVVRLKSMQ